MQQSHLPNLLHWDFMCIHWVMIMFYYKTCCPSSTMKALKKWLHIIISLWMKNQNNSDGDCYLQQNQIIHVYIYNLSQKHQAQFFQWLCWGLKLHHSQQLCIASYVASSGYFISQDLNDDWIFIAVSCFLNFYQFTCFHDTQRRTSSKVKVPAIFAIWKNNFTHIIGQLKFQMKNKYFKSESLKWPSESKQSVYFHCIR